MRLYLYQRKKNADISKRNMNAKRGRDKMKEEKVLVLCVVPISMHRIETPTL